MILVAALPAYIGLRNASSSISTLQTRQGSRQILDGAQHDLASGEAQLSQLFAQSSVRSASGFPLAFQQQQDGLRGWAAYKARLAKAGTTLPGTSQLDADLTKMVAMDAPSAPTGSAIPGTSSAPAGSSLTSSTVTAAYARTTAQAQVTADFGVVRQADDQWWETTIDRQRASAHSNSNRLLAAVGAALLVGGAVSGVAARAAGRRDRELAQRDHDLYRVATANELEARLQRALEMSNSEERVYEVIEQALAENLPSLRTELLLADSSRAHFQQILSTGSAMAHHCGVESPARCPAAQQGQILSFSSSEALDACGYLKRASPEPRSATCLPVSIGGLTLGVVHAAAEADQLPSPEDRATLELIARRASDRIGMLRAFLRSERQASTDSLTGLPNRRTLESEARALNTHGTSYAVAFADLDHFKRLNATHGHAAGDRALQLFAQVLRESLRPADLVGRFGGEEFVIVLPGCARKEALQVLERIRQQLAAALASSGTPKFTVSIGLAEMDGTGDFLDRVAVADAALLQAKSAGRDQIITEPDRTGPMAAATA